MEKLHKHFTPFGVAYLCAQASCVQVRSLIETIEHGDGTFMVYATLIITVIVAVMWGIAAAIVGFKWAFNDEKRNSTAS